MSSSAQMAQTVMANPAISLSEMPVRLSPEQSAYLSTKSPRTQRSVLGSMIVPKEQVVSPASEKVSPVTFAPSVSPPASPVTFIAPAVITPTTFAASPVASPAGSLPGSPRKSAVVNFIAPGEVKVTSISGEPIKGTPYPSMMPPASPAGQQMTTRYPPATQQMMVATVPPAVQPTMTAVSLKPAISYDAARKMKMSMTPHQYFAQRMSQALENKLMGYDKNVDDGLGLNWDNRNAIEVANKIASVIGQPQEKISDRDGYVFWRNVKVDNLLLRMVKVYDGKTIHLTHEFHLECVKISMDLTLRQDQVKSLTDVSPALSYNSVEKVVTASADSWWNTIILLYGAKALSEEMSYKEIKPIMYGLKQEIDDSNVRTVIIEYLAIR